MEEALFDRAAADIGDVMNHGERRFVNPCHNGFDLGNFQPRD